MTESIDAKVARLMLLVADILECAIKTVRNAAEQPLLAKAITDLQAVLRAELKESFAAGELHGEFVQDTNQPVAWRYTFLGTPETTTVDYSHYQLKPMPQGFKEDALYTTPPQPSPAPAMIDMSESIEQMPDGSYRPIYKTGLFTTTPQPAIAQGDAKDAERLDWLQSQTDAYGSQDMHEGNRWMIDGPFMFVRDAIDAAIANKKGGQS